MKTCIRCNLIKGNFKGNGNICLDCYRLAKKEYDKNYNPKRKLDPNYRKLVNDSDRLRYKSDLVYKLSRKLRVTIRRAFKRLRLRKSNKILALVNYTAQDLRDYLTKYLNKLCPVCNKALITPDYHEIDHITPICSAKNEDDIVKLNQFNNLRLICIKCNRAKVMEDLKFRDLK